MCSALDYKCLHTLINRKNIGKILEKVIEVLENSLMLIPSIILEFCKDSVEILREVLTKKGFEVSKIEGKIKDLILDKFILSKWLLPHLLMIFEEPQIHAIEISNTYHNYI